MSLSKLQETVKDREAQCAAVHGVTKNQTWTTTGQNPLTGLPSSIPGPSCTPPRSSGCHFFLLRMSNGPVLLTVPKLLNLVENTLPSLFPTVYPDLISHYYLKRILTLLWTTSIVCNSLNKLYLKLQNPGGLEIEAKSLAPDHTASDHRIWISIQVWAVSKVLKHHLVLSLWNVPLIYMWKSHPSFKVTSLLKLSLFFPVWSASFLFWALIAFSSHISQNTITESCEIQDTVVWSCGPLWYLTYLSTHWWHSAKIW